MKFEIIGINYFKMKQSIIKRFYEAMIQKSDESVFEALRAEWASLGEDVNKLPFEVVLYGGKLNGVGMMTRGTKPI